MMNLKYSISEYQRAAKRSHVLITILEDGRSFRNTVRVSYDYGHLGTGKKTVYFAEQEWDEQFLVKEPPEFILSVLDEFVMKFVKSLPQRVTGKYPHIRLWMDMNHSRDKSRFFGHPDIDIPGYVFGRYKTMTNGRYDGLEPLKNTQQQIIADISSPQQKQFVENDKPLFDKEKLEEVMKEMATKKKIVKAKAPIDPSKVKRPECPKHQSEMEFDKVKQKWRCQELGCKMVARPARDEDDRSVHVGKGETSLRVVSTEEETVVLLVSDDNVALNITPLLDVKEFLNASGILELAETAQSVGKENFTDGIARPLNLMLRPGVIGAENLLIEYGKQ